MSNTNTMDFCLTNCFVLIGILQPIIIDFQNMQMSEAILAEYEEDRRTIILNEEFERITTKNRVYRRPIDTVIAALREMFLQNRDRCYCHRLANGQDLSEEQTIELNVLREAEAIFDVVK